MKRVGRNFYLNISIDYYYLRVAVTMPLPAEKMVPELSRLLRRCAEDSHGI